MFRLSQLVALATILASVCSATASSHPFSDPPQKEINASTIATRPPLPKCASSSSSSTCTLVQPAGSSNDSWPSLDASYVGTQWLAPPQIPGTIKAHDSYYQIAKLPLSRSSCAPGSEVEARLVLRFPDFEATAEKTRAMAEQSNTAGIMATSNPLASNKNGKTRRCVLAGVEENASAAEAAKGAEEESPGTSRFSEARCTECDSFVTTSGDYVRCPAVPGVWYVDRLPLRVPSASAGWCDDGSSGGSESGGDAKQARLKAENEKLLVGNSYASFVVNAGSEVEVALFDVVGRSSGPGAPSA